MNRELLHEIIDKVVDMQEDGIDITATILTLVEDVPYISVSLTDCEDNYKVEHGNIRANKDKHFGMDSLKEKLEIFHDEYREMWEKEDEEEDEAEDIDMDVEACMKKSGFDWYKYNGVSKSDFM